MMRVVHRKPPQRTIARASTAAAERVGRAVSRTAAESNNGAVTKSDVGEVPVWG